MGEKRFSAAVLLLMLVVEFRGNRIARQPGRGILEYSPTHNHIRTSQVTEFEYNNGPGTHTHRATRINHRRIHIYTGEHYAASQTHRVRHARVYTKDIAVVSWIFRFLSIQFEAGARLELRC